MVINPFQVQNNKKMKTLKQHSALLEETKKYNSKSIVLEGKGVDRYIDYIEWESGEPLTESEMDNLLHNQELHSLLMEQYFLR